ncbi:hypothetical protein D9M69_501090 [compost metagenome]
MVKAMPRGDFLFLGSKPGIEIPDRAMKLHNAAGDGDLALSLSSSASHCRQVRGSTKASLAARDTLIFAFKRPFLRRRRCLLFILGDLMELSGRGYPRGRLKKIGALLPPIQKIGLMTAQAPWPSAFWAITIWKRGGLIKPLPPIEKVRRRGAVHATSNWVSSRSEAWVG